MKKDACELMMCVELQYILVVFVFFAVPPFLSSCFFINTVCIPGSTWYEYILSLFFAVALTASFFLYLSIHE